MADFAALPLFTDSLLADTSHLNDEEFGRYMRLLIVTWRSPECRIPNDPAWIAKRLRLDSLQYDRLIKPLVAEFFRADADADADALKWLTQKRLKKEWKYTVEKREKNKAAAKSRWNKDKISCERIPKRISKRNAPSPPPSPLKPPTSFPVAAQPEKRGAKAEKGKADAFFCIEQHIDDPIRAEAKRAAPGWDLQVLMKTYDEKVNGGELERPFKPRKAFPAWCASWTKGKPP